MKKQNESIRLNKIKTDVSKENPGLHLLYVKWGVSHLLLVDECIRKLSSTSNLNMMDFTSALLEERGRLVENNAAYRDADDIIRAMRNKKGNYRLTKS